MCPSGHKALEGLGIFLFSCCYQHKPLHAERKVGLIIISKISVNIHLSLAASLTCTYLTINIKKIDRLQYSISSKGTLISM